MRARATRQIENQQPALMVQPAGGPKRLQPVISPAVETAMHPHIYRIALGCWAAFLAIFWLTFWVSANALFMVVVGTFYAAVFFGVPYILARQVPGRTKAKSPLMRFLAQPFATNSGLIQGYEALLQVVLVPLCLVVGGTAIAIIIRSARATH